jgi:hypothetical protein
LANTGSIVRARLSNPVILLALSQLARNLE